MFGLAVLVPIAIGWGLVGQYFGPAWCIAAVAATVLGVFRLTRGA